MGPGAPSRSLVIDGSRGIGKTALVNELVAVAESTGWVSLRTRSTAALTETIRDSLIPDALTRLDSTRRRGKRTLESINIAGLGGVSTTYREQILPIPTLELRLRELLDALARHGTGVVLTIDEVQDAAPDDLAEIAGAYQMLLQEERDIALIVTGLSDGVHTLLNLPGTTFMRRAKRFTLGSLSHEDTEIVLRESCRGSGIEFDESAAVDAAEMTYGYPYLVQLVGYLSWEHAQARGAEVVLTADVMAVREEAIRILGEQVHEPSIKGLPARQREFLKCMAEAEVHKVDSAEEEPGTASVADVAQCMGRTVTGLSDIRQRLIDKELVEPAGWGKLRFVLPYAGEYLRDLPTRRRVN